MYADAETYFQRERKRDAARVSLWIASGLRGELSRARGVVFFGATRRYYIL